MHTVNIYTNQNAIDRSFVSHSTELHVELKLDCHKDELEARFLELISGTY